MAVEFFIEKGIRDKVPDISDASYRVVATSIQRLYARLRKGGVGTEFLMNILEHHPLTELKRHYPDDLRWPDSVLKELKALARR